MATQEIVIALRICEKHESCAGCPFIDDPTYTLCSLRLYGYAAGLLESLTAELEQAKQERDEWKRRAEAAEYDMHRAIMDTASACDICKYPGQEGTPCSVCNCVSHWQWRGPCAENGGDTK